MKNTESNPHASQRRLDRIVKCESEEPCPVCKTGKVILMGRRTLGFCVDKKMYCTNCMYEEEF
jgi:hypothetical protein